MSCIDALHVGIAVPEVVVGTVLDGAQLEGSKSGASCCGRQSSVENSTSISFSVEGVVLNGESRVQVDRVPV